MLCCRIVNGIKNKNIKKQPWSNVECFAFGVAKRLFFMFLFLCPSPMVFPLIPQKTCTRFSVFGYILGGFYGGLVDKIGGFV